MANFPISFPAPKAKADVGVCQDQRRMLFSIIVNKRVLQASFHATLRMDFFTSYNMRDIGIIRMENNGVSYIGGISDVMILTSECSELILREVMHVADVRLDLISDGKLDEEGYC